MTEVKLCSRGDGGWGVGGWGVALRGQQHSASRPQGWMAWWGCVKIVRLCCCSCLCLCVVSQDWSINEDSEWVTGSKEEVSAYHSSDPCFLINFPAHLTPPARSLSSTLPSSISPPPPPPPPKTANLASVRAWRTLSAVSTAELVVAPERWGAVASR